MDKATEIFEKHWKKRTGRPLDEQIIDHMQYAIDAINEALNLPDANQNLLTNKQQLIEKIEWINREIKAVGYSDNSDNFSDLIKYQLTIKKQQYTTDLGRLIFDELDDLIKQEITAKQIQHRENFYLQLQKNIKQ